MKSTNLRFVITSAFLGLTIAACSPMSDNSLLSDKKDDNASLTVDKTPKAEELYLKLDTASIGPAVVGSKLEISGECYTSTYSTHRIVASEGGSGLAITDVYPVVAVSFSQYPKCREEGRCLHEAQCRNGRFNFSLNIGGMAAGGHQVRVSLEAFDGLGAGVVNDSQASSVMNFTK